MTTVEAVQSQPGVVFTRAGDVGLVLWHGDVTLAANRWIIANIVNARRAGRPYGIGVQLIAATAGLPDAANRRYVTEAFREELPRLRRFVNAPLGDSMKQSLVRTVLRGMAMVGDRSRTLVIAGSIDEALELAGAVASDETPPKSVLLRAVDDLFASVERAASDGR